MPFRLRGPGTTRLWSRRRLMMSKPLDSRVFASQASREIEFPRVEATRTDGRHTVTYTDHFLTGSPSWTIDPAWLQRVSDVVDMATERGFYVITNMHHGKPLDVYLCTYTLAKLVQFSRLFLGRRHQERCKPEHDIREIPTVLAADW